MKMKYFLQNLGDNYAFRSIVFGATELLPLPEWLCAEEFFMHSLMQSLIWWIRAHLSLCFHPVEVLRAWSWDLCWCGCVFRFLQVLELLERCGPEEAHSNLSHWDLKKKACPWKNCSLNAHGLTETCKSVLLAHHDVLLLFKNVNTLARTCSL